MQLGVTERQDGLGDAIQMLRSRADDKADDFDLAPSLLRWLSRAPRSRNDIAAGWHPAPHGPVSGGRPPADAGASAGGRAAPGAFGRFRTPRPKPPRGPTATPGAAT